MTGIIKSLIRKRGFGFIRTKGEKEVFFHRTDLENAKFEELKEGDVVKFNIVESYKGAKAVHIVVIEKSKS